MLQALNTFRRHVVDAEGHDLVKIQLEAQRPHFLYVAGIDIVGAVVPDVGIGQAELARVEIRTNKQAECAQARPYTGDLATEAVAELGTLDFSYLRL